MQKQIVSTFVIKRLSLILNVENLALFGFDGKSQISEFTIVIYNFILLLKRVKRLNYSKF